MSDENKRAVEAFNEMANVYQDKYMNVDIYQEALAYFLQHLHERDAVLDIACGPGNVLQYLGNRNSQIQLAGIDMAPEMIRLATLNVPQATLDVADALNLSAIKGCYNAIVCNFLLPYLPETEIGKLFSAVSNLLVPGGMFYLGFITEAHNHSQMVQSSKGHPITMYYYAEQYIAGLLRHHQFMLGFSKSYASNNSRQEQRDIIMVASKQAHANEKLHPL